MLLEVDTQTDTQMRTHTHTYRQTGDLISAISFLEVRLKRKNLIQNKIQDFNKNFWEELICLLSLHKLTVNNIQCHHLHTKFHPNPPIGSNVAPTSEV
jgi:hypothetical protein